MPWFDWLIFAFRTPSAFYEDPIRYRKNVIGHTWLVGALPAALAQLLAHLLDLDPLPVQAATLAVCGALYGLWELAQYRFARAEASDCIADWAFVMHGHLVAATLSLPLLVLWAANLQAGVLFRKHHRVERKPNG